jgi:hypothetical protein
MIAVRLLLRLEFLRDISTSDWQESIQAKFESAEVKTKRNLE